jgi:hypothetical protein
MMMIDTFLDIMGAWMDELGVSSFVNPHLFLLSHVFFSGTRI